MIYENVIVCVQDGGVGKIDPAITKLVSNDDTQVSKFCEFIFYALLIFSCEICS